VRTQARGVRDVLGRTLGPILGARTPAAPGPGPLPEFPPGWSVGPPDFVGVGIKKAGTSWWHRLISCHPGVHRRTPAVPGLNPPGVKELHFFQVQWAASLTDEGAMEYHRYFPRPPSKLVGEWTPRYMVDFWTPAQLGLAAPDTKILVMVRDPVERYRSGVSHYLARHSGIDHPRVLVDEVEHGRYGSGLDRIARHYPRSQILLLQYERCVLRPRVELERTYSFLGLEDTAFTPEDLAGLVNKARGEKLHLDAGLRAELAVEYRQDALRLAEGWGIDLSLWPNFADLA